MNDQPRPPNIDLVTILWILWLSCWGGAVSYLQRIKGRVSDFSFAVFFIELLTSNFVGLLTAFACFKAQMDWWDTGIAIGTAAMLGNKAVAVFRRKMEQAIGP